MRGCGHRRRCTYQLRSLGFGDLHVKNVTLSNVKLPIAALTQYACTGACNNFGLFGDGELFSAYCLELNKWAEERGWEFEEVHEYGYEYGLCNVKRADN